MNIAFYNGVSGLSAYQQDMDTLAHNMSNINTYGYKPTRTGFSDLLYTQMNVNGEDKPLTGHGVKASSDELLLTQGNPLTTNNMLDFALVGEGFFATENKGARAYTRNGAFDISVEGSKAYLVTMDGSYVLDGKGKQIALTKKKDGTYDLTAAKDKLGIYNFANPYGLQRRDGSSFTETAVSGEATAVKKSGREKTEPYQLVQGAVEQSAVDMAQTMVDVMISQKAFSFNAKMVQTADQVEEIVNNLR